jgi:hypothetical protein
MGLLSRISSEEHHEKKAGSTGLLARSEYVAEVPRFSSFSDFSSSYGLSHCAVLTIVNGSFVITACTGLDASTIGLSVSSPDFWNGTLKSSGFSTFLSSDGTIAPFYQLFSPEMKEKILGIHILRISSDKIFFYADIGQTQNFSATASLVKAVLLEDFSEKENSENHSDILPLSPSYNADLFLLSAKIAISSIIRDTGITDTIIADSVFSTIYDELFNLLSSHIGMPDRCITSVNGEIKLVILTHGLSDDSVLQFHISRLFAPVLGNVLAESVILLKAASSSDPSKIKSFITEA